MYDVSWKYRRTYFQFSNNKSNRTPYFFLTPYFEKSRQTISNLNGIQEIKERRNVRERVGDRNKKKKGKIVSRSFSFIDAHAFLTLRSQSNRRKRLGRKRTRREPFWNTSDICIASETIRRVVPLMLAPFPLSPLTFIYEKILG